MSSLSAVIITLNESRRLPACLASLAFCQEILVVDSGSQDGTQDLAKHLGARVLQQDWLGFGAQKQWAVGQANFDWVLCIDADEVVSEALAASIQAAMQQPEVHAYRFARCNRFLGRQLRHGEGYPDWSLRLFNRQFGAWSQDAVHEKVEVQGKVAKLEGDLLHESEETLAHYVAKQNRYTSLQAESLAAQGAKYSAMRMLTSPLFRFFRFYLFRLGFLDGKEGLIHTLIGCQNSFFKYAKLYEQKIRKSG
ncbi:MAG: glycosyltransferase family 2 protein [Pseudomonadales bacterium]|nr:glycosyltransferase family 2 protein [Pseudomonadales bacterium]